MKKKVRAIVVSDHKYVWWYKVQENLSVIVSPSNDKTSTVSIAFPYKPNNDNLPQAAIGTIPYQIIMQKNDVKETFEILSPKFISMMIEYLSSDMFVTHSNKSYNGFELLRNKGYSILDIKFKMYW